PAPRRLTRSMEPRALRAVRVVPIHPDGGQSRRLPSGAPRSVPTRTIGQVDAIEIRIRRHPPVRCRVNSTWGPSQRRFTPRGASMTVRLFTVRRLAVFGLLLGTMLICWRAWAQAPRLPAPIKPPPAHRNVRYGLHERNVLDVWRAKPVPGRAGGTPLVV